MSWDYQIHEDAAADLDKLGPAARAEVTTWMEKRIRGSTNPEQLGKPLRGSKHGLWRYRVRDYRILCRLEKKILIVVVVAVGHRSRIYEK